jgi:hypothetical protein
MSQLRGPPAASRVMPHSAGAALGPYPQPQRGCRARPRDDYERADHAPHVGGRSPCPPLAEAHVPGGLCPVSSQPRRTELRRTGARLTVPACMFSAGPGAPARATTASTYCFAAMITPFSVMISNASACYRFCEHLRTEDGFGMVVREKISKEGIRWLGSCCGSHSLSGRLALEHPSWPTIIDSV